MPVRRHFRNVPLFGTSQLETTKLAGRLYAVLKIRRYHHLTHNRPTEAMLLENLCSKFSGWHRNERHSVTITNEADSSFSNNFTKTKDASSLFGTSDYQVQLIGIKTLSGDYSFLPVWKFDSINETTAYSSGRGSVLAVDDGKLESFTNQLKRHETFVVAKDCKGRSDVSHIYFEGALRAASTGDVFYLERCIDVLGVPVDASTLKGVTMLQCALVYDHVNCVKVLLKRGADVWKTTAKGRFALHTAARYNALRSLKLLLAHLCAEEKKMDKALVVCPYSFFFVRDNFGDTPLHLACRQNNEQCVKVLLKNIASKAGWAAVESVLLSCNAFGQNPLHVACLWRCYRNIRFFITAEFENALSKTRFSANGRKCAKALRSSMTKTLLCTLQTGTVLHELALRRCSSPQTCISSFPERNLIENPSATALATCFDEKKIDDDTCMKCEEALQRIVELLLSKCPELVYHRNSPGLTPLMTAVINNAVGVVNALFTKNIDIEEEDGNCRTALHHAASRGIVRQVATLLAHGASPSHRDSQGATPLHYATMRSFTSCVRLLYRANSLIDIRTPNGHTAFMWAAMYGVQASLHTMLEVNPMLDRYEKDKDGATALHLAGTHDQYDAVKFLVASGWYIEARNYKEETPLLAAAAAGRVYGIRALLECDADAYAVDEKGNSVFHLAAASDMHRESLHELLLTVPDSGLLNSRNLSGDTPLFCAIKAGAIRCVRDLLKHGADVHLRDSRGWNPLMMALKEESCGIVSSILKYAPNVNCYSAQDGCSALTLAIDFGNADIIDRLKERGAKLPCEIVDDAARRIQRWYRKHMDSIKYSVHSYGRKEKLGFKNSIVESDVLLIHRFGIRKLG